MGRDEKAVEALHIEPNLFAELSWKNSRNSAAYSSVKLFAASLLWSHFSREDRIWRQASACIGNSPLAVERQKSKLVIAEARNEMRNVIESTVAKSAGGVRRASSLRIEKGNEEDEN